MKRSFVILPVAMVLLASFAFAGDVFIDSKWKIEMSPTGGGTSVKDTIIFIHNTFTSEFFEKHGFKPCAYEENANRMNMGQFSAENKSEKEGTLKWTGSVNASAIQGDVVWTKANGDEVHYSFSGEKVQQK